MDDDQEVIRRLTLINRKLDHIVGLLIPAASIGIGFVAYKGAENIFADRSWGETASFLIFCAVLTAAGRYLEKRFRDADP